jgi:O-methyltransferase
MKRLKIKLNAYMKGLILLSRPHLLFGWLSFPFLFISNVINLSKWIAAQDKKNILNDFYSAKRDYAKRYTLYEYIVNKFTLADEAIDYIEFGVCGANSFQWWLDHSSNIGSRFYGFDTFEGLPENWGTYEKGEMSADIPQTDDTRAEFIKGLFQDTVPNFLVTHNLKNDKRKVIHLDADLFSSTLYALTALAHYLRKGDILLFDEFNVPNHEFFAFKMFCDAYYIKTKLLGAVNNYYQVALIIV